jgi:hypothetical protein
MGVNKDLIFVFTFAKRGDSFPGPVFVGDRKTQFVRQSSAVSVAKMNLKDKPCFELSKVSP